MDTSLYVIFHELNLYDYKIGKHSGDCGKLMSRYRTHSSNIYKLVAFFPGYGHLENCIHKHLHDYRLIKEETNKYSEWFRCDIYKILKTISYFINIDIDYNIKKIEKNTNCFKKNDNENNMKEELKILIENHNQDIIKEKNIKKNEDNSMILEKDTISDNIIPINYPLDIKKYDVKSKFFIKEHETEIIKESNHKFNEHINKFKRFGNTCMQKDNILEKNNNDNSKENLNNKKIILIKKSKITNIKNETLINKKVIPIKKCKIVNNKNNNNSIDDDINTKNNETKYNINTKNNETKYNINTKNNETKYNINTKNNETKYNSNSIDDDINIKNNIINNENINDDIIVPIPPKKSSGFNKLELFRYKSRN